MGVRRVLKKRVLPTLWLVIGLVVAVSLAKIAFAGDAVGGSKDGLTPTGQVPDAEVVVERGTVENTLVVDGTIDLDPSVTANATEDGDLVYVHVPKGAVVQKGAPLFQIRTETSPEPDPETGEVGAPKKKYVNVLAPATGKVGSYGVAIGEAVTKGSGVVVIQPQKYKAVGSVTPLDRYRLLHRPKTATVTIQGGPEPFTCTKLAIGDTATAPSAPSGGEEGGGGEGGGGDASTSITCRVPGDVTVFDGLTMSMSIDIGRAEDVLVVPVSSVRGLLETGTVWVIGEDGIETERPVKIGATDGQIVEVKSGLKEGDRVLRFVPGSEGESGPGEESFEGEVYVG